MTYTESFVTNRLSADQLTLAGISASADGLVWGVDNSGEVYQYNSSSQSWQKKQNSVTLVQVSVGNSTNIWSVDRTKAVFQYNQVSQTWQAMPGELAMISAAADGAVWGLDSTGGIYQYDSASNSWQPQPGSLKLGRIAVGSGANIWGIDSSGSIYQYQPATQTWQLIPGNLVSISAAEDGVVFGLDQNGNIFMYVGEPQLTWYQCAGALEQISVASYTQIWGIDLQGNPIDLSVPVQSGASGEVYIQTHGSILPQWDAEDPFDETRSTHLWIVRRAAILAGQDPTLGGFLLDMIRPQDGKQGNPNGFHNNLYQGLYDADWLPQYNNPRLGQPTYKSHFYDPDTGLNWLGETEPTALTNGRLFYNTALDFFRAGDMKNAGYNLGLSLHYLTDLTQPMHAANYTWLSSFPPGYHTDFESYVLQIQSQIQPPSTYTPPNQGLEADAYLFSAAKKSKDSYYNQIVSPGWFNWQEAVRPWIDPILQDAITITSQYLVAWFSAAQESPLYRLYKKPDHFYCISAIERDYARYTLNYSYEGVACQVFLKSPPPGTMPFYRLTGMPQYPDHLYTTSEDEKNHAIQVLHYTFEGIAGYVYPPDQPQPKSTMPLYRLVHPAGTVAHFYTTSPAERDYAVSLGYRYEDIACYVPIEFGS